MSIRKRLPGNSNFGAGLLFVTIIMPIRNEAAFFEPTLGSVLARDYPQECLEILVADGMSDDGTRALMQRLAADCLRGRLVDSPGRTIPTAQN